MVLKYPSPTDGGFRDTRMRYSNAIESIHAKKGTSLLDVSSWKTPGLYHDAQNTHTMYNLSQEL